MFPAARAARAFAFVLLPSLLAGCGGATTAMTRDVEPMQSISVSAREYGFVRPAADVTIVERESSGFSSWFRFSRGGDLWNRVRSGMALTQIQHPQIDARIDSLRQDPRHLERLSERAGPYLHLIVEEIDRRRLPMELALLPQVESRFNPQATSPKSAAGIWQFMPYTGREMGLRQDSLYDGRRDILASTRAALDYLEQLNARFDGDWTLAMAAYNCGPGCVSAAIERNRQRGQPTDFWSLNLPAETRHYVPRILANARLVANPRRYGLNLPPIPDQPQLEVVQVRKAVDLARVAHQSGLDLDTLRRLNPGLKHERTSANHATVLLVPAGSGKRLSSALERTEALPPEPPRPTRTASASTSRPAKSPAPPSHKSHVVRAGDTLYSIARRHGTDVKTLTSFNRISPDAPLLPGQTLRIPGGLS
ncbi:MAG: transglycosylase SLT domain-containing protein [Chromatiaceae bacterium]|nr:transglycosylase SLT domain-containing protein [Chromatiaceae bacterium]